MRAIMDDRATTEEEKRRIASEMEAQRLEIESQTEAASREREKKEALQAQIKAIEGKLLHGADDLEARNKQLEEAAAKGVRDIADRERLKLERQRAVAAMEEKALLSDEKFASKKEEVADKTRKLKKMFSKYQTAKQDLEEHADELAREKDDMQESITLLKKTLQLKNALIEHFVPPEVTEKVLKRAVWEDETESWALERLSRDADAASASNASATRNARPVSAAGRATAADGQLEDRRRARGFKPAAQDAKYSRARAGPPGAHDVGSRRRAAARAGGAGGARHRVQRRRRAVARAGEGQKRVSARG